MIYISERKRKRIEQMWRNGWSVGAICDKVNVTKRMVYKYNGESPIVQKERNEMKEAYLPPALRKRIEMEKVR